MPFVDFLKSTVVLSGAAATLLAVLTIAGGSAGGVAQGVVVALVIWWAVAAAVGSALGREDRASPAIARLLASARTGRALPELAPWRILLNRLWPLLAFTVVAAALAFLYPQVPGIATGFAIIWALAWRRQDAAVAAIEDRDVARFYVARTSPVRSIRLLRTPGFRSRRYDLQGADAGGA